jgi:signal transduction histidine kinase
MSGAFLRCCFRSLLAAGLASTLLCAQDAPLLLTNVRDILALPDAVATEGKTPVRLHGVVTDVSLKRDEVSIYDGTATVSAALVEGVLAPDLGLDVEVEGRVYSETFNEKPRTRVEAAKITVMGTGKLPQPTPLRIPELAEFKSLDQWVEVEGVVLQIRYSSPLLTIQITSGRSYCNVLVRDWPKDNIPKNWVGGTVRVVGNNRPYTSKTTLYAMMAPSPAQVKLVKPGFVDPFDAPATTATALQKKGSISPDRYKLTGTLLDATAGNVMYFRDVNGGAFSLYTLYPLDDDKSGRFSTPVVVPNCKPGDVVEVVGTASYIEPAVHLNFAQLRVIRSGPVPAPTPTDIASVVSGKSVNDLVELHGRLITLDDVLVTPTRWRTTMKIEDAGHKIVAFLDSPKRGALADLRPDELLKIRAIATGHPHFPEVRLWLPTPRDVESLGVASEVIARRVWTWIGVTAACIIPLLVWVLMLRRSRTEVRELNAGLEKRVAERTAELEVAKDELSRSLSQERELNELKTRFISLVSHEFRTPLGITMSAVELMRHYSERLSPEKLAELLDDIHGSTLRMSGLMEQVLILGRVEAGKTAYNPVPLNLEELCGKLTDEGLSATNRRCPVNFSAQGDFADVQADEGLIRHIFSNLLSNAVKYSPEGTPVEFTVRREGDYAIFTVQDRGIGIPEADQGRLFEAFHRASNVGEVPGTGLGLLLVKRCVDLHHGSISFETQQGKGTTFTVKLPVSERG